MVPGNRKPCVDINSFSSKEKIMSDLDEELFVWVEQAYMFSEKK